MCGSSSFNLFRYEKRVKWSLLRVLQFWKTIRRCLVDGGECGSPQEMCGWIFVNLAFCCDVEGGNVMKEGICADILAEAGCI